MNLNVLEKLAREILKGNDVSPMSAEMLNRAVLSPIEHRSLQSLSWQIAASARHTPGSNITVAAVSTYRVWI